MRIALVIQKLAGLRGGAERVVIDLAKGLASRGHRVVIVTFEPAVGPAGYDVGEVPVVDLFPRALRGGVTRAGPAGRLDSVEGRVSIQGNARAIARLKWSATHGLFARRLARWLREHPQDTVVGFLPPAISAVALAGERLGAKRPRVIASTHNLPAEDFGATARWDQNPVARRTNLWALEAVDAVTVLQPEFVSQLPLGAQTRAVVLPNAVSRLAPDSGRCRAPRILGVGRLTDVKRFDLLIEAFARIADDHPSWEVLIYGEGPERANLEEAVGRTGLDHRIRLLGTTADMAGAYDEARILCHPARYEGFGLSVAEGILHGLYVLASRRCMGVNRLVEHGASGLLVDEGDDPVTAFAAGLRTLIDEAPCETARAAAADDLAAVLSPVAILDEWERLLSRS